MDQENSTTEQSKKQYLIKLSESKVSGAVCPDKRRHSQAIAPEGKANPLCPVIGAGRTFLRGSRMGEEGRAACAPYQEDYAVNNSSSLLNLINTSQQAKKGTKTYKAKIVVSGDIVQVYEYQKVRAGSVRAGRKAGKEKAQEQNTGEASYTSRIDNAHRAISQCKRVINSNAGKSSYPDKFVTTTFKEEETDLNRCNNQLKNFIKRLEYRLGYNVEYVAVPQIQWERYKKYGVKVWHYHILLFGMDYVKNSDLREIWGHGFVRINAIDKITDVGSYVSRYMEKDFEGLLVKNHRRYLTSSGLHRPTEMRAENILDLPSISEDFKVFETEYKNNEQVGWVKFKQYNFRKPPEPQKENRREHGYL